MLRVSDDKKFCMEMMQESMQNNMAETVWPKTQYLWPLHPILSWVNDKAGLLYGRGEAPLMGIPGMLEKGELIFVVAGSIPNLKSTPLVDEWFGLLYQNGQYAKTLTMDEVIQKTKISNMSIPNTKSIGETEVSTANNLRESVVAEAKTYLEDCYKNYENKISPSPIKTSGSKEHKDICYVRCCSNEM